MNVSGNESIPWNGSTIAGGATTALPQSGGQTWDDATWVLISTFIIFTMQSGFGLLESGSVSVKNEVNIMYKGASDVIFGGTVYWLIGYGLSFGEDTGSNPFCGIGYWAVDVTDKDIIGEVFMKFSFQLSFATTAATIVSGAVSERIRLHSYIIFAALNIIGYCIPAHWVWGNNGFLYSLGAVDIAGSGVVHLCGGTAALVVSLLLGPRTGRYDNGPDPPHVGNGTNIILGTFFLWWGWLGFNCGSTFGVQNGLWISASRTAACTLIASMGGGIVGVFFSVITKHGQFSVAYLCNGILGGLVGITASCAVVWPWHAFIIGAIGALVAVTGTIMFDHLHVDDPVGAISVHGLGGIWGLLAVGLFMTDEAELNNGQKGLFYGGGGYSLGIQALTAVCIIAWCGTIAFIIAGLLRLSPLKLRMSLEEEEKGADLVEHGIDKMSVYTNHFQDHFVRNGMFGFRRDSKKATNSGQNTLERKSSANGTTNMGYDEAVTSDTKQQNGNLQDETENETETL